MKDSVLLSAKDALLSEYEALRSEINQRIVSQGVVIHWIITLIGGFILALLTLNPKPDVPFIMALLNDPTPNIIGLLAIVSTGFSIGVELLMTYWVYQTYMIFRISNYIPRIELRLKTLLELPSNCTILGWDKDCRGLADVVLRKDHNLSPLVRFSIKLSSWAQPFSLFVIAFIGILITFISVFYIVFINVVFETWFNLILIITVLFITITWFLLGILLLGLHKWHIVESPLPYYGFKEKLKQVNK